jgi:hypothetical protein
MSLVAKHKRSVPQVWAKFNSLAMMGIAKPVIRYHEFEVKLWTGLRC